jgi:hypothetical protein
MIHAKGGRATPRGEARTPVIQAKVDRGHTPAGHVRRPYMIFLSMGALIGLVAAAVIGD